MTKRLVLVLIGIMVLMTFQTALAEPAAVSVYELADNVLTVRLPANITTGYEWGYEISNEDLLEMLTMEYVTDDAPEGFTGVGGTWICSFTSALKAEGQGGEVTLTLSYARPWEIETHPENTEGYVLGLWVTESGELSVEDVEPFPIPEVAD